MSVNCVYCGHVNPDGSTVCLSCGRTLPPAPSSGPGSYGQQPPQQPPQSWGSTPQAPPGAPSSYPPPAAPFGGSYPPPDQGYGQQGSSFGNQPPGAPSPSFGNQQGGYGASSYPPPPPAPSFGQAPAWGGAPAAFGATNPEAQSAKQMAIIALVVSCLAIPLDFCCYIGLFLGPLGAILGFVAKGKLSRNNASDGQGLALGAIIVGAIAFIIPIVIIVISLLISAISH
jgi:hypothetical protein